MLILVYYLLFVIAPIIFWLMFFAREERSDPEPRKLLFLIFLLGIGIAIFASGVELALTMIFFPHNYMDVSVKYMVTHTSASSVTTVLIFALAAVTEELLKYLALKEFLYTNKHFNQIADGVFYGVTLALGFVLVENTGYFLSLYAYATTSLFVTAIVVRGVLTSLLHITAAGITGYALGKKKFSPTHPKSIVFFGVLSAILLHMLFNFFISLPIGIYIASPLVIGAFAYLIILLNKPETKAIWRLASAKEVQEMKNENKI